MANYYLAINKQRLGPFPEEELLQNGMTPDTLVWSKGMENWTKAGDVPELAKYLSSPPQIPEETPIVPEVAPQYAQQDYDAHQNQQPSYQDVPPRPANHIGKAICSTIFCCPPFGVVAIIKASRVNRLYDQGRYDAAEGHSRSANKWANIAIRVGLGIALFYFIYFLIIIVLAGSLSR